MIIKVLTTHASPRGLLHSELAKRHILKYLERCICSYYSATCVACKSISLLLMRSNTLSPNAQTHNHHGHVQAKICGQKKISRLNQK